MPSKYLILCRPFILLPPVFCSIRLLSSESNLGMRWPEYWNFSFSISPSYEYSGSISFRIEWIDVLAVWGSLKSLLQHHSLKASILWHSAFFTVQLSHPYMTTYYSAIKMNEIMPFAATWIDLEIVMLSEVSQTEKEEYYMISFICGI